jgi:hypothetical protein
MGPPLESVWATATAASFVLGLRYLRRLRLRLRLIRRHRARLRTPVIVVGGGEGGVVVGAAVGAADVRPFGSVVVAVVQIGDVWVPVREGRVVVVVGVAPGHRWLMVVAVVLVVLVVV